MINLQPALHLQQLYVKTHSYYLRPDSTIHLRNTRHKLKIDDYSNVYIETISEGIYMA